MTVGSCDTLGQHSVDGEDDVGDSRVWQWWWCGIRVVANPPRGVAAYRGGADLPVRGPHSIPPWTGSSFPQIAVSAGLAVLTIAGNTWAVAALGAVLSCQSSIMAIIMASGTVRTGAGKDGARRPRCGALA